jgi:hypothetical protein
MLLEVDRALEQVDDEILAALSMEERATLNELLARAGASGPLECDKEAAEECDPPAC